MFSSTFAPASSLSAASTPAAWLGETERAPAHIAATSTLVEAIDRFQSDADLRLLPVVDGADRPVGAIFEKDVRQLLLNPFGHALLRNPAYGRSLSLHVRPCPVAEATLDVGALIDVYRAAHGSEGMILTLGGRLHAVITNRRLVNLAADREIQSARARIARASRIERASERLEQQVAALGRALSTLSHRIEASAGATSDGATLTGERASAVASATAQTSVNMAEIADQGRHLSEALDRIEANSRDTRAAAAAAATLVGSGSVRTRALLRSAQSIDSVIGLITDIAGQVNLLALNATIEAARAGDAGRGFTVVANQVKQLSQQTGTAAARITEYVRDICGGIDSVASGHGEVEQAIDAMATQTADVLAAVEAQQAATHRIADMVAEAASASAAMRDDLEAIGQTSHGASETAREMHGLARQLRSEAAALSDQVNGFLDEIRAA